MKIAGFWRYVADIASTFHHEGHEGHEEEQGKISLFVVFVVNFKPTTKRRIDAQRLR